MPWLARLRARSQRMCSSAVRTASRSGSQIGASECGTQQSPRPASADYTSRPSTHCSILGNRVWRVGKTHTADARAQGRGDDLECFYASLFEDDLDDVSNRLDAAMMETSAACMRPEP